LIEHDSYLRKDDHERVKIANRFYEVVTELLKNPEKVMEKVKKVRG